MGNGWIALINDEEYLNKLKIFLSIDIVSE